MTVTVKPLSRALGAEIGGVDLSKPLDDAAFDALHAAWMDHLVVVFRDQRLTDEALERFSARLGALDRKPVYTDDVLDTTTSDYVCVISNVKVGGKAIGDLGDGEAVWHMDMTYNDLPPMASALYALEVPAGGGDTGFANLYLAWESLPADLKARVATLQAKHDATYNSAGGLRRGMQATSDARSSPGAVHPLVRTHPVTGRNALYLGRRNNAYIVGLALEESERLLDRLWAHATQPRFTWHHQWREGDLLLWDNRCLMHRRDPFDPNARRVMHRTQVKGDRPVFVAAGDALAEPAATKSS
jgi:taurine dioxygenase